MAAVAADFVITASAVDDVVTGKAGDSIVCRRAENVVGNVFSNDPRHLVPSGVWFCSQE
jgi:hypothetical protein